MSQLLTFNPVGKLLRSHGKTPHCFRASLMNILCEQTVAVFQVLQSKSQARKQVLSIQESRIRRAILLKPAGDSAYPNPQT